MATARFSDPRTTKAIRAVTDRDGLLRDDPSFVEQVARVRLTVAGQPTR